MTLSLQVTYRKGKPLAAYIYLAAHAGQKAARTKELAPGLLVDFDANDEPFGIEVVSPDLVSSSEIDRLFEELGLDRPDPKELEPLLAA